MIVALLVATVVGAATTTALAQRELGGAVDGMVRRSPLATLIPSGGKSPDALAILTNIDPVGAEEIKRAWIVSVLAGAGAAALCYALLAGRK